MADDDRVRVLDVDHGESGVGRSLGAAVHGAQAEERLLHGGGELFERRVLVGELAVLVLLAIPAGLLFGRGLALLIMTSFSTETVRLPLVINDSTYAIAVVVVLKAVFALKAFDTIYTLTNGGPGNSTKTLAYFVYEQGFNYYDMGYAAAAAYLLTAILLVLAGFYIRLVFAKGR